MEFDSDYWDQRYEEGSTGWDRGQPHPALQNWLENQELTPCSIAIPGCGRGHEVIELSEKGFMVTGIDYAGRPVAELRSRLLARHLPGQVIQRSIFEYLPDTRFDAVYEQTCLCAIPPERRVDYESALFQWLNPKGRLFALFAQTDSPSGPPFHCSVEDMKRLFVETRWEWSAHEPVHYEHPSGKLFEKAVILRRKP